jgi:hypothetical protein
VGTSSKEKIQRRISPYGCIDKGNISRYDNNPEPRGGFFMSASKKEVRHLKRHTLSAVSLTVGSPELGAPTLTVGQIVEQLSAVAPDPVAISERIRHWTREGILVPVDQHHAGTGRHRRYSSDTGYEAAVLNSLANAGLHLVSRPYIQDALRHARAALQKWRQAISAGHELPLFFLVISHEPTRVGSEPIVSTHEGVVNPAPAAEIMIVVNLSQLFLRMLSRVSQR